MRAPQEFEYRVTWQRAGCSRRRQIMQTLAGARVVAERQETAAADMTWLEAPLPPLVYGPVIEQRRVGPWE